ncbi:MAG: HAMP domain-containing histidine kinase [Firmicutes bacterium]|nr:HAMP domain-containing histidine kinase [Bacillota bacterium]
MHRLRAITRSPRWQSLRTKLTAQTALSIAALVVAMALIVVVAVGIHLFDAAQAQTMAFYLNLSELARTSPRIILQYTRTIDPRIWIIKNGKITLHSPNSSPFPPGPMLNQIVTRPILAWRLVRRSDGYRWVIDWPLGPDRDLIQDLIVVMASVTVAATIAGALLGRWTTHRVLQPVSIMARSVESMLNRQQYSTIGAPSPHNDEFTQLATVLSRLITTLADRSQRDRMLLAEAAHQLRTPLEVIRGNLDILTDWEHIEPETEQDTLEALIRATGDMTTLVENLLTLEHARNSQHHLSPVNLAELIEEVGEDAKAVASGHTVTYELRSPILAPVSADLVASRRALWVLVENAIKYSQAGSTIEMTLGAVPRGWALTVTNHGNPIPSDELDHLFDRFYRGRSTRHIAGSGLGLAIAKALMESQNGDISVHSDNDSTSFTLFWPQ